MGKFSRHLGKASSSTDEPIVASFDPTQQNKETVWDERLSRVINMSDEIAESFRVLRSKILHPTSGSKKIIRSIMISSAMPAEGKSFVSANLGVALGQGVDQHSLIVDCDLRKPALAELLGVKNDHGLVDYLRDNVSLSQLIQSTSIKKLSVLPAGQPPHNPSELLGSLRMHDLVSELTERYPDRFVIFDTPPFQVASESIVLSQVVDGVVLVVRHGVSALPMIEKAIADIGRHKIIGVIFNGHESNFITNKLLDKGHYSYETYKVGHKDIV